MKTSITSLVRTAALATALLGLGASGLSAKQLPIRGCFHDTWLSEPILDFSNTPPNPPTFLGINIDLGGAGWVSLMSYPVSFLNNNQTNNMTLAPMKRDGLPDLLPFHGEGINTLRDRCGSSIILKSNVSMDPVPKNGHQVSFSGTYEIIGGTGRFAGATGTGKVTGWADFDDPTNPLCSSGPGYWDFAGTINLPDKHAN